MCLLLHSLSCIMYYNWFCRRNALRFIAPQIKSGDCIEKKGKRTVKGVPQSQTAALPRHQEEEETDESKQAQIEQTYDKH